MSSVADQLADLYNSHSIDLTRLEYGERQRIESILKQLEEDLVDKLKEIDPTEVPEITYQQQRLATLLAQTRGLIYGSYEGTMSTMEKDMFSLAEIESKFAQDSINTITGVQVADAFMTREQLQAVASDILIQGAPSKDWWRTQRDKTRKDFETQMRLGILEGESVDDLVRRVRGTSTGRRRTYEDPTTGRKWTAHVFKGGIMDVSTKNARALVRTSVAAVSAEARFQTFIENNDVVKGIQQLSMLDGKTTEICRAYSNKVWVFEEEDLVKKGGSYKKTTPSIPIKEDEDGISAAGLFRYTPGMTFGVLGAGIEHPALWKDTAAKLGETFDKVLDPDDLFGVSFLKEPPANAPKWATRGVPGVGWAPVITRETAEEWTRGTALAGREVTLWTTRIREVEEGNFDVIKILNRGSKSLLSGFQGILLNLTPIALGYQSGGWIKAAVRVENPLYIDVTGENPSRVRKEPIGGGIGEQVWTYDALEALEAELVDVIADVRQDLKEEIEALRDKVEDLPYPSTVELEKEVEEAGGTVELEKILLDKMFALEAYREALAGPAGYKVALEKMGYDSIIIKGVDPTLNRGADEQIILFDQTQMAVLESGHIILYHNDIQPYARFRSMDAMQEWSDENHIYIHPDFFEYFSANLAYADVNLSELARLSEAFPEVRFRVGVTFDPEVVGSYNPDSKEIAFNGVDFSMTTPEILERSQNSAHSLFHPRYFVPCSTAVHEFGHALYYSFHPELREPLDDFLRAHHSEITMYDVSEYAQKNISELFAESFEALVAYPQEHWTDWLEVFYERVESVVQEQWLGDAHLISVVDLKAQLGLKNYAERDAVGQVIQGPNGVGTFPNNLSLVSYVQSKSPMVLQDDPLLLNVEDLMGFTMPIEEEIVSLLPPPMKVEKTTLARVYERIQRNSDGKFLGVRIETLEGLHIEGMKYLHSTHSVVIKVQSIDEPNTYEWIEPDYLELEETEILVKKLPEHEEEYSRTVQNVLQLMSRSRLKDPFRVSLPLTTMEAEDLLGGVNREMLEEVLSTGIVGPSSEPVKDLIGKEIEIPTFWKGVADYSEGEPYLAVTGMDIALDLVLPPGTPAIYLGPLRDAFMTPELKPANWERLLLHPGIKLRIVDWGEHVSPQTGEVIFIVQAEVIHEGDAVGLAGEIYYVPENRMATLWDVERQCFHMERNQLEAIWDQVNPNRTVSMMIVEEGMEISDDQLEDMVWRFVKDKDKEELAKVKVFIPRPVPHGTRVVLPSEEAPVVPFKLGKGYYEVRRRFVWDGEEEIVKRFDTYEEAVKAYKEMDGAEIVYQIVWDREPPGSDLDKYSDTVHVLDFHSEIGHGSWETIREESQVRSAVTRQVNRRIAAGTQLLETGEVALQSFDLPPVELPDIGGIPESDSQLRQLFTTEAIQKHPEIQEEIRKFVASATHPGDRYPVDDKILEKGFLPLKKDLEVFRGIPLSTFLESALGDTDIELEDIIDWSVSPEGEGKIQEIKDLLLSTVGDVLPPGNLLSYTLDPEVAKEYSSGSNIDEMAPTETGIILRTTLPAQSKVLYTDAYLSDTPGQSEYGEWEIYVGSDLYLEIESIQEIPKTSATARDILVVNLKASKQPTSGAIRTISSEELDKIAEEGNSERADAKIREVFTQEYVRSLPIEVWGAVQEFAESGIVYGDDLRAAMLPIVEPVVAFRGMGLEKFLSRMVDYPEDFLSVEALDRFAPSLLGLGFEERRFVAYSQSNRVSEEFVYEGMHKEDGEIGVLIQTVLEPGTKLVYTDAFRGASPDEIKEGAHRFGPEFEMVLDPGHLFEITDLYWTEVRDYPTLVVVTKQVPRVDKILADMEKPEVVAVVKFRGEFYESTESHPMAMMEIAARHPEYYEEAGIDPLDPDAEHKILDWLSSRTFDMFRIGDEYLTREEAYSRLIPNEYRTRSYLLMEDWHEFQEMEAGERLQQLLDRYGPGGVSIQLAKGQGDEGLHYFPGMEEDDAVEEMLRRFPKTDEDYYILDTIFNVDGQWMNSEGMPIPKALVEGREEAAKIVAAAVEYHNPETGLVEYYYGMTHGDAFVEMMAVHPDINLEHVLEERIAFGGLFKMSDGTIVTADQLRPVTGAERVTAEGLVREGRLVQETERGVLVEGRISAIARYTPTGEMFEATTHMEARDLLMARYPDFNPSDIEMDLVRVESGKIIHPLTGEVFADEVVGREDYLSPLEGRDVLNVLSAQRAQWKEVFTPEEIKWLDSITTGDTYTQAYFLRLLEAQGKTIADVDELDLVDFTLGLGGDVPTPVELWKDALRFTELLGRLAPLQESIIVYRGIEDLSLLLGVGVEEVVKMVESGDFESIEGLTYTDSAWVSTTPDLETAKHYTFPFTPAGSGAILKIEIPAGTPAIYLDALARSVGVDQKEVRLDGGHSFEILGMEGMEELDQGVVPVIRVRLLSPEAEDVFRVGAVIQWNGVYYIAQEHYGAYGLIYDQFPELKKEWGLYQQEKEFQDLQEAGEITHEILLNDGRIVDTEAWMRGEIPRDAPNLFTLESSQYLRDPDLEIRIFEEGEDLGRLAAVIEYEGTYYVGLFEGDAEALMPRDAVYAEGRSLIITRDRAIRTPGGIIVEKSYEDVDPSRIVFDDDEEFLAALEGGTDILALITQEYGGIPFTGEQGRQVRDVSRALAVVRYGDTYYLALQHTDAEAMVKIQDPNAPKKLWEGIVTSGGQIMGLGGSDPVELAEVYYVWHEKVGRDRVDELVKLSAQNLPPHRVPDAVEQVSSMWGLTPRGVEVELIDDSKAKPKRCFNNAYNWIKRAEEGKYVLGYITVHGVPIEHAWVKIEGMMQTYYDPTPVADDLEVDYYALVELSMEELTALGWKTNDQVDLAKWFRESKKERYRERWMDESTWLASLTTQNVQAAVRWESPINGRFYIGTGPTTEEAFEDLVAQFDTPLNRKIEMPILKQLEGIFQGQWVDAELEIQLETNLYMLEDGTVVTRKQLEDIEQALKGKVPVGRIAAVVRVKSTGETFEALTHPDAMEKVRKHFKDLARSHGETFDWYALQDDLEMNLVRLANGEIVGSEGIEVDRTYYRPEPEKSRLAKPKLPPPRSALDAEILQEELEETLFTPEWADSLDYDTIEALDRWVDDPELIKEYPRDEELIFDAMLPSDRNLVLYRGTRAGHILEAMGIPEDSMSLDDLGKLVGLVYPHESRLTATSLNIAKAQEFERTYSLPIIIEYRVPEGIHMLSTDATGRGYELEILLGREDYDARVLGVDWVTVKTEEGPQRVRRVVVKLYPGGSLLTGEAVARDVVPFGKGPLAKLPPQKKVADLGSALEDMISAPGSLFKGFGTLAHFLRSFETGRTVEVGETLFKGIQTKELGVGSLIVTTDKTPQVWIDPRKSMEADFQVLKDGGVFLELDMEEQEILSHGWLTTPDHIQFEEDIAFEIVEVSQVVVSGFQRTYVKVKVAPVPENLLVFPEPSPFPGPLDPEVGDHVRTAQNAFSAIYMAYSESIRQQLAVLDSTFDELNHWILYGGEMPSGIKWNQAEELIRRIATKAPKAFSSFFVDTIEDFENSLGKRPLEKFPLRVGEVITPSTFTMGDPDASRIYQSASYIDTTLGEMPILFRINTPEGYLVTVYPNASRFYFTRGTQFEVTYVGEINLSTGTYQMVALRPVGFDYGAMLDPKLAEKPKPPPPPTRPISTSLVKPPDDLDWTFFTGNPEAQIMLAEDFFKRTAGRLGWLEGDGRELEMIKRYQSTQGMHLVAELRKGVIFYDTIVVPESRVVEYKDLLLLLRWLDDMMEESLLTHPMVSYRGIPAWVLRKLLREEAFGGFNDWPSLIGLSFEDLGFCSTSLDVEFAQGYLPPYDPIFLEIRLPKGTRAIYASHPGLQHELVFPNRKQFNSGVDLASRVGARELVVDRNSSFLVVEVREENGYIYIVVELIQQRSNNA